MPTSGRVAAAFVGGVVGTLLRAGLSRLWFDPAFPWATFSVNLIGSAALGYLAGSLLHRPDPMLRFGVGAGVLGALTTFSTFVIEIVDLAEAGGPAGALAYAGASVLLGTMLAATGFRIGSR